MSFPMVTYFFNPYFFSFKYLIFVSVTMTRFGSFLRDFPTRALSLTVDVDGNCSLFIIPPVRYWRCFKLLKLSQVRNVLYSWHRICTRHKSSLLGIIVWWIKLGTEWGADGLTEGQRDGLTEGRTNGRTDLRTYGSSLLELLRRDWKANYGYFGHWLSES